MTLADLDDVLRVERTTFGSPWARKVFVEELEREFAHVDLLRDGDRVVAFVNYWIVGDEIQVLNVATLDEERRRGHAARLLDHVIGVARAHACRYLTLEVRRGNQPALGLYRKLRFRAVGVRPGYYPEDAAAGRSAEDAVVMLLDLDGAQPDDGRP